MAWVSLVFAALFLVAANASQQLDLHQTHKWHFPRGNGSLSEFLKKASSRVVKDRILGGTNPINGEFPATVLIINEATICYGAIIGRQHVLSTASCMEDMLGTEVLVAAGEVNLDNILTSNTIQVLNAVTAYALTDSLPAPGNMDIVVVELDARFATTNYVQAAALAASEPAANADTTVTSWGAPPGSGNVVYTVLRKLGMKAVADADLGASVNAYDIVGAKAALQDTGVCDGDSGAPLYTTNKQLIGVLSLKTSNVCGDGRPVGFTSAVYYRDWINCMMYPVQCDTPTTTTTTPRPTTPSGASSAGVVSVALVVVVAVAAAVF